MAKQLTDLQRYALLGAQARLQQIAEETANIYLAFPQLRRGRQDQNGAAATTAPGESESPAVKRRRGRMSAAQRKAVGERMKKYWAARRAQKGAAADGAKTAQGRKAVGGSRKNAGSHRPRKMSAAARKRISDAQKKRWAAQRKAA
jgi:hypothetical protein